jgi:hypothetical protein
MPIFFLDIPADETYGEVRNLLPLILGSVFAIGGLAAIFFWRKNNKNK